ncbi:histone-lysine N-methyltransferase SETMAR [Elysia marginata]|uniref:Histone-lysine N-methyltransferase SETMAR n=1 Tax=Elysia marginata TaxID=1093978 RepID=A0AAV4F461_9GAST|nr:histone-lysine N-methyltransferase SETMAR [Elysia marginata]
MILPKSLKFQKKKSSISLQIFSATEECLQDECALMLTYEIKMQRKTTCAQLLKHYEEEGEEFIQRIVTGDESWIHHCGLESKRQSMEYRHKSSPSPRKFKVVASARKVMLTVFWDSEGIVHNF